MKKTPRVKGERTKEAEEQKHNKQFVDYYKYMGIVDEEEWDKFYACLKVPLDICFRINTIDKDRETTRKHLFSMIADLAADEETRMMIPAEVMWYPERETVFCFNELSRVELRKNPKLKAFHQFLVRETETGRTFRQEKVSMIPVTLLDVQTDHSVLDMCAAPGSKTIQILEALHANGEKMNMGFCVANDVDAKRAYLLTHQARRLDLPSLFITNNDARFLPNLKSGFDRQNVKFDRVLCDVPCSGDGTLRKNLGLWKNFNAHMGHTNHPLQVDILSRGIEVLATGGRLVYSTCSFNPIENEAVVQAILEKFKGKISLVDVSKEVSPHLRYRPGFTSWKVYHRGKGKKEAPAWHMAWESVPDWKRSVLRKTMFHDTYTYNNN